MEQISLDVLAEQIKNLTQKVEEGFAGIHERQNNTNGNIVRNASCINELQKTDIKLASTIKSTKMIWITITVLLSMILTLMGKFVF